MRDMYKRMIVMCKKIIMRLSRRMRIKNIVRWNGRTICCYWRIIWLSIINRIIRKRVKGYNMQEFIWLIKRWNDVSWFKRRFKIEDKVSSNKILTCFKIIYPITFLTKWITNKAQSLSSRVESVLRSIHIICKTETYIGSQWTIIKNNSKQNFRRAFPI